MTKRKDPKDKLKVGRPSAFKVEYIKKAQTYLDECADEVVQELSGLSAKGTELYKNRLEVNLPTIEGFAAYIGVNKTTLYEWDKISPEFSDALGLIKAEQHRRLVNAGLSGQYNPTIAKLILSSNHGYKEKSDVTTNDEPIRVDVTQQLTKVYGGNDDKMPTNG